MTDEQKRTYIEKQIEKNNGILRLAPAWVARDLLPAGRRLGLPDEAYDAGERGEICERWLGSTTKADNRIGPEDEGLSYIAIEGDPVMTLRDAVALAGPAMMGEAYAATHRGLGRLPKLFDYADRLPFHLHQRDADAALVGRHAKEEAYYFPEGLDMGPHPETFFGVHPWIADQQAYNVLLPYLEDWDSNLILRHSRAYLLVPDDGFLLPAGVPHAPGSALTVELQEDSDVFAILQAQVGGRIISKEQLYKDVRPEDRAREGERVLLGQIDWEISGDPYFYENYHLGPRLIEATATAGGEEYWIFYNTTKFSGKKLVVHPGQTFTCVDRGVYSLLVWQGQGIYGGHPVEGGNFDQDELLVTHERAIVPLEVENIGTEDLVIFKFFGPDVNPDVPMIAKYKA